MLVAALVLDGAVDKGEQRIVLATTHVRTRVDVGAVLTDENRARSDGLAGEALAAKTLTARVAANYGRNQVLFYVPSLVPTLSIARATQRSRPGRQPRRPWWSCGARAW